MRRYSTTCLQCGDSGAVTALNTETNTVYAFSCSCPVGVRKGRVYPVWDREKFPKYELLRDGIAPRVTPMKPNTGGQA